jgi:3-hydroxyacyl-[acyl-carrier-protein] dehydratase
VSDTAAPDGQSDESSNSDGVGPLPLPIDVLPHRPPFLFVDELTALVPGQSATGLWRLTGDEWFFPGHFPGRPTLPGVLMCEAIAQVGALAVLCDERFAGKLPLFGGLDGARFRRQVGPGDTLELVVELGRMSARAGKGSGRALLDGKVACECDLMFVLADA